MLLSSDSSWENVTEKEAVSGSVFSTTAGHNEMPEIFPYEENKMKVKKLKFKVARRGLYSTAAL
jgi:hypothetical protein